MMRKSMLPPIEAAEGLGEEAAPSFRSSAVARMAQMPVATLRIWEQRYQAVRPGTAPSGHRLYSAADVQRVMLLRQLAEQGHAIGATAGLSTAQLQALAAQQGSPAAARGRGKNARPRASTLRVVVVGHALAARLQRPAVAQQLGRPLQLLAVYDTLQAAAAAPRALAAPGSACDLLIWQLPALQAELPAALQQAQQAWAPAQLAVVYRFAGAAAKAACAATGAMLLHEPHDDDDLGHWLAARQASGIGANTAEAAGEPNPAGPSGRLDAAAPVLEQLTALAASPQLPPRRFDDAELTAVAGLTPIGLACECPRHLAELLLQLASFETYSAGCANRSPEDAELHRYLQAVAGTSRALFESALVKVAQYEGMKLA